MGASTNRAAVRVAIEMQLWSRDVGLNTKVVTGHVLPEIVASNRAVT